jgi:hypothetical protein
LSAEVNGGDGHQHRASAHGDAPARGQRHAHRIAQRAAIRLVHQRRHVGERLADYLLEALIEQRLGRMIDVIDAALRVDGDDAFAHGVERRGCPRSQRRRRARRSARRAARREFGQHLQRGEQQRRLARAVDQRSRQFHARDFAVHALQLDLVTFRGRLAGEPPAKIVVQQLDIFRRDEMAQRLADHVGGARPEQAQETRIRKQDAFAMHQHRIVHRLHQALEQLFTALQMRAAPF